MDLSHLTWRKASYSGNNGGDCVEVATTPAGAIAIRDSKDPHGPTLDLAPTTWHMFTRQIKDRRPGLA